MKTSFLLNIFNFLVQYEIAVLLLKSPEAIEALSKYNLWKMFLKKCIINIGGFEISAFWIVEKGLSLPKIF